MAECAPMTLTTDPQVAVQSPARTHRAALVILTVVFLAGVVFIVQAALPYFALTEGQFGTGHWPRRWWLLAAHHHRHRRAVVRPGPVVARSSPSRRTETAPPAGYHVHFEQCGRELDWPPTTSRSTRISDGSSAQGLASLATAWLVTTEPRGRSDPPPPLPAAQRMDDSELRRDHSVCELPAPVDVVVRWSSMEVGTALERLAAAAWVCWAVPLLITEAILQGRKMLRGETRLKSVRLKPDQLRTHFPRPIFKRSQPLLQQEARGFQLGARWRPPRPRSARQSPATHRAERLRDLRPIPAAQRPRARRPRGETAGPDFRSRSASQTAPGCATRAGPRGPSTVNPAGFPALP